MMPSEGVSNSSWQPGKRHGAVQPLWTFDRRRDTISYHGRYGGIPFSPLESRGLRSIGVKRLFGWKGNGVMRCLKVVSILVLATVSNPVLGDLMIRFWSDRDGDSDSLFVMNSDGSDPVNVNKALGMRRMPVWSPDRTKIAYASHNTNKSDIFVMDADGSNLVNLSDKGGGDYSPRWSPDGTQVLWYGWPSMKAEGSARIYLNDADGSDLRDLGRGLWPHWSPDGTKIGFTLDGVPNTALIMNADGSGRREVPNRFIFTRFLLWSPDGSKVAFLRIRLNKDVQIYVVNVDGSDLVELTMPLRIFDSLSPHWSPDGTKIVFTARFDIFVVNVDGTKLVNLTKQHNPAGRDLYPTWSPDGTEIVFQTNRDGNEKVYIMNDDGSNPFNLSNHPAEDCCGYWYNGILPSATPVSPQGKLITIWGQIKAVTSDQRQEESGDGWKG